jgi:hypothetical protein
MIYSRFLKEKKSNLEGKISSLDEKKTKEMEILLQADKLKERHAIEKSGLQAAKNILEEKKKQLISFEEK